MSGGGSPAARALGVGAGAVAWRRAGPGRARAQRPSPDYDSGVTARPCGGLVLAWALALAPAPASAQTPTRHPTIGLALSGGAARGLPPIGVLKALAQAGVSVDVAAGPTMGTTAGGLTPGGNAPPALASIFPPRAGSHRLTDPVNA